MDFYNDYELYIFDLDGTLYEDTSHFDYYGKLLKEQLPIEMQEHFTKEYEQMKEGNHAVAIGKAYDVERDSVLTLDPLTLKVVEVTDWNGTKWEQNKVANTYAGKLTFDFEKMIAIGDGWWLPFVCAKHFGVEDTYNSYLQTKEYMVTDQFQLTKTPGLKQGLEKLKEKKQIVLMTNSDAEDVGRLLKELDLDGIFDDVITSAMKPTKTTTFLNELLSKYKVTPEQAVSIGDNFINEIAPALELGMNALLIQAADVDVTHERLQTVKTLADAL
ncbi:hydrolase [Lottiidibacillus patelloidae]|uniref:Hydrolase n=1 Tax=Lottiidibacillus patelloidae TaxID=2670334 RepID=A0A263BWS3_9BACI|nr:HAD family hydrolase [Lottiidibacillus patelloidae]OZM58193.1 hydrolase [Lottiidibacillus patelloidae]